MTLRNVFKHRGGMQDLLIGRAATSQTRAGTAYNIMAIDIPYPVATTTEMQALDVAQFHRARVYASANNYTDYIYDATDGTGISSDTGPGTWLVCPESSSVLSVESKPDLRTETPAYNYQVAVVFGGTSKTTGTGGIYYYDDSDTVSADDGDTVLVTGAGERWIKILLDPEIPAIVMDDSGAVNLITITSGRSAYPTDQVLWFKAALTNTGACTINLDGIGARALTYEDGSALDAGAIVADRFYAVKFENSPDAAYLLNPDCSETVAEAGTNNQAIITPLRLAQVFADRIGADPLDAQDTSGLITPNGIAKALAQFDNAKGFALTDGTDANKDIIIGTGVATDRASTLVFTLGSAIEKQFDATWAEGTLAGGMAATLTLTANRSYYIHAIFKADGTVDVGADVNADASLLLAGASGYSYYCPVGGFRTDASNNITDKYSLITERVPHVEVFTSSGTFVWPLGVSRIDVEVGGAGGGGGVNGINGVDGGDSSFVYNSVTTTGDGGTGGGQGGAATHAVSGGTGGLASNTYDTYAAGGGGGGGVDPGAGSTSGRGGASALQGQGGNGTSSGGGGGGGGVAYRNVSYVTGQYTATVTVGAGGGSGGDSGAVVVRYMRPE